MKRSPAHTDVTRPDSKFRWAYIVTRFHDSYVHKSLQKFLNIERCGVPQSDWVADIWGSKVIRTGPPRSQKFLLFFYSGIEPPK